MRLFFPLVLDAVRDVVCKIYKEGVIIKYVCNYVYNVFVIIFNKYLHFNLCPGDDGDVLTCLQVGQLSLFFNFTVKAQKFSTKTRLLNETY